MDLPQYTENQIEFETMGFSERIIVQNDQGESNSPLSYGDSL